MLPRAYPWTSFSSSSSHDDTTTAPYKIGFTFGILAAVSAIPLVFDLQTVLFFNENFAKSELPEGGIADLDTVWKVGAFSWGYMEVCM